MLPIIEQANKQLNKIAIYADGKTFTYEHLINESQALVLKALVTGSSVFTLGGAFTNLPHYIPISQTNWLA